jgi:hypothetical protein
MKNGLENISAPSVGQHGRGVSSVHQPQGGVGLFERAHARVAYLCLAYEGDGRSISRSQGGQWRQDDKAPGDQILVFECRALLGGGIERPNFGPENQILVF